jgi:hypothetical protein
MEEFRECTLPREVATEGNRYDPLNRLAVTPPTLGLGRSAMFEAVEEGYVVGPGPLLLLLRGTRKPPKAGRGYRTGAMRVSGNLPSETVWKIAGMLLAPGLVTP